MTNKTSEEKMEIKYRTAPNGAPLSEKTLKREKGDNRE